MSLMLSRTKYLAKRAQLLVRHQLGWRGIVMAGIIASTIAAFLIPERAMSFALFGTVTILFMVALMSERVHSHHQNLAKLNQRGTRPRPQPIEPEPVIEDGPPPPDGTDSWMAMSRLRTLRTELSAPSESTAPSPSQFERLTSDGPLVTVIVPCYNDSQYLGDCLESLVRQSTASWTAIVVDDCSTDDSVAVATQYVKRDDRIRIVRHYKNSGLPASRNTGLRLAESPYVTFLDSDDFLLRDSLADRLNTIINETDPHVAGAFCGVRTVPETAHPDDYADSYSWNSPGFKDFVSSQGECPFNAHAPLMYTEVVRSCGGFDETMTRGAEDWDLWQRMMRVGYYFIPSKYRSAVYRQKPQSMIRAMPAEHLKQAEELMTASEKAGPGSISDTASGPSKLEASLGTYHLQLRLVKRICSFLGLATVAGDEQLRLSLDLLPADLPRPLLRHLDLTSLINRSFQRALSLDPKGFESVEQSIAPIRAHLIVQVQERLAAAQPIARIEPHAAVVFMPTDAHQASIMASEARELPEAVSYKFVTSDRVDGDQGAERKLEELEISWHSNTHWSLAGGRSKAIVTMYPTTAAIAAATAAAHAAGIRTIEITDSLTPVPRLECHECEPSDITVSIGSDFLREVDKTVADAQRTEHEPIALKTPKFLTHVEEYPTTRFDSAKLEHWKNAHVGERVFIIGNGPSLNDVNLRLLAHENTIAVNGIFYAAEDMGFDPTYYVVEDTSVMKENIDAIQAYSAGHKFFPSIYRDLYGEADNVSYFMMNRGFYDKASPNYCVPRFSTNAAATLYAGQSVTIINLQLAYYMGFSEVILIGMDFSYSIPGSALRQGDVLTSTEDDQNHFHPNYFGKGKTWKDPKLDRVLANYALAKRIYEADNRMIVNATPGGKLELFGRVDYDSLFSRSEIKG